MKTMQEVFDMVYTHLLTQNKVCKNSLGECVLWNAEGLACAIGCLFTTEIVNQYRYRGETNSLENGATTYLLRESGVAMDLLIDDELPMYLFVHELRRIHDCYPPTNWKKLLQQVATRNNLTVPSI